MTDPTPAPATRLSAANQNALAHVRARAGRERAVSVARIGRVLSAARVPTDSAGVDDVCAAVRRVGVVTLNFHPDRLLAGGRSVAEVLCEQGTYRNQFETKISSGGLTAFPGGDRDRWEETLFGGAYHAPGVRDWERPKYGGLDLMNYSDGACPRFGSCHLRLSADALGRSTFSFGDSANGPEDAGVIDAFEPVLAALLEGVSRDGGALGRPGLDVPRFVERLLGTRAPRDRLFERAQGHAVDDYIEAQVHGVVSLAAGVEALVIDPSFGDTPTGEILIATAERYGLETEWHPGFVLTAGDVPRDVPQDAPTRAAAAPPRLPRWRAFCARGRAARLATRVVTDYAVDGSHLDAAAIGRAAVAAVRNPDQWEEWGSTRESLQCLKDLWLILVAHGRPRSAPTVPPQDAGASNGEWSDEKGRV